MCSARLGPDFDNLAPEWPEIGRNFLELVRSTDVPATQGRRRKDGVSRSLICQGRSVGVGAIPFRCGSSGELPLRTSGRLHAPERRACDSPGGDVFRGPSLGSVPRAPVFQGRGGAAGIGGRREPARSPKGGSPRYPLARGWVPLALFDAPEAECVMPDPSGCRRSTEPELREADPGTFVATLVHEDPLLAPSMYPGFIGVGPPHILPEASPP